MKKLNNIQLYITQESGTEKAFSGKLLNNKKNGIYSCLCCQNNLFSSKDKFNSKCGWPSFSKAIDNKSISFINDMSYNMKRVEVRCKKCNAHLGHVFPDETNMTGQRYCINSVSLIFIDELSKKIIEG